jgi:Big-like domain-containing protein
VKSSLLLVVVSLIALAACSPDSRGPAQAPEGAGVTSPSSVAQKESKSSATCSAEASKSFAGKSNSVRLRITPCRVARGSAPRAVLKNTGDGELGYGFGFKLERKMGDTWRWINRRQAFILPLFYLAPGERSDPESLAIYFGKPQPIQLRPGLYRVTKSVDLTPGRPRPPTMEVRATFQVV